ncbi:hypothetical protein [Lentisalinibacter sediminis]|uniref:hypothetical protein n=1 Tax=Lentisalinibacter sediminis TaxID=2992237 RepID=UPI0038656567
MKTRNLSSTDRQAILRRAIIRAEPEYYAWSPAQQEQYRLSIPEERKFLIRQSVLRSLFGFDVDTEEAMREVLQGCDDEKYLLLNSTLLPFQGIGDNDFFLNECFAEGVTLLDFATVGEYARHDHEFQEQARKTEDPTYEVRPFQGDLYPCWARLNIDGEFHYATIMSLARYLTDRLDNAGSERIRSLIPHRYVAGTDHGKREKGGSLWGMRVEAGGMEPQLDELQHRYYGYLRNCHSRLLERFADQGAQRVHIERTEQGVERNIEFVFSDQRALDAVRFRRFYADCQRIAGDSSELAALIDEEEQAAFRFLEEQFRDIQKNYDPSVVPFRKRRKIIVADGALDDLS